MDLKAFHDIIIMQHLGNAMDFSDAQMETLKEKCYSRPDAAKVYLEKFQKYLKEMERRSVQKIPKELLQEMFPGKIEKDVYLSGKDIDNANGLIFYDLKDTVQKYHSISHIRKIVAYEH